MWLSAIPVFSPVEVAVVDADLSREDDPSPPPSSPPPPPSSPFPLPSPPSFPSPLRCALLSPCAHRPIGSSTRTGCGCGDRGWWRGAPVVVLAHGFPELAYSWRHQIPALADAGYHVLAPDQRGYGGSSEPAAIDAYEIVDLTADLVGLLDDSVRRRRCSSATTRGVVASGARCYTRPLLRGRRHELAAIPRPPMPTTQRSAGVRGQLLLHPLLPGSRGRRRRTRTRPGDHDATADRPRQPPTRPGDADARDRARGLRRPDPRTRGHPAWLTQQEFDHYVDGIHPHRLHRPAQLVPKLRSQLGTHGHTRRHRSRRRRCSSAGTPTRRLRTRPATAPRSRRR